MEKIKREYHLARERLQTNMSAGMPEQRSAEEISDSAPDKELKVLIMIQSKGLILGTKTSRR